MIEDTVVAPRAPWSARMAAGEMLRITDLEGQQAVDFLCFNAHDPSERYHAPNTIKTALNIFIGKGSVLRSTRARPLMTVIEDSCGRHDTLFGCCSFEVDQIRYGRTNAESCQRNFERELARRDVPSSLIAPNVNFFMAVPVEANGDAGIADSPSRPGDHVVLRADMDVLAVLSNCPEELNPATGANGPTPIRVERWRD